MSLVLGIWLCLLFVTTPPGEPTGFVIRIGEPGQKEVGSGILPLPEGGYMLSGGIGNQSFLQRYDSDDQLLWHRSIDFNAKNDFIQQISLDSEGYLLGAGQDRDDGEGSSFYFRYDYHSDNFLWVRNPVVSSFSQIGQLIESPIDGHFITLGNLDPGIAGSDAWILRTDRNSGAVIFQQGLHLKNTEVIRDGLIHQGTVFTAGCVRHGPSLDHIRASISKYSLSGVHQWTRSYLELPLESARTYGRGMVAFEDTLVIATSGPLSGADINASDACLLATNLQGDLLWTRHLLLEDSNNEAGLDLHRISDGYFLIGTHHFADMGSNILVVRLDLSGRLVWARSVGGPGNELAEFGALMDGFVYVHGTTSLDDNEDALLVKLPLDGSVNGFGCEWVHPLFGETIPLADLIQNEVNPSVYNTNTATFLSQPLPEEEANISADSVCLPLLTGPAPQAVKCDFSALEIPSVFSPNQDGHNDRFHLLLPEDSREVLQRLEVYNRWGERVFLGVGPAAAWDGQYRGFPAPADVYLYRMEVECRSETKLFVGEVSLLR